LTLSRRVDLPTSTVRGLEVLAIAGLNEHAVAAGETAAVDVDERKALPAFRHGCRGHDRTATVVLSADVVAAEQRLKGHARQRQRFGAATERFCGRRDRATAQASDEAE